MASSSIVNPELNQTQAAWEMLALTIDGLLGATNSSRYVGATASGAPTTGIFVLGDWIIDLTGKVWICTTAGQPGTWTNLVAASLPAAGGTVSGLLTLGGGTATNSSAPIIAAPGFSAGAASQLSDLTRDYMVYLTVGTGGGTFGISIGPANTTVDVIIPTATVGVAGVGYTVRLPASWWLKVTATTSTIANQIAVGC
jgi:hypothetical protein